MLAELVQQFWAQHDIAIFATLATLDVNDHAPAVDIGNFQVRQLGTPHPGGVERHEQRAMVGSKSCIDELRNFFLAQDRGQRNYPFRIGSLGCAPDPLERLGVEEPQSREIYRDGARSEFPLRE